MPWSASRAGRRPPAEPERLPRRRRAEADGGSAKDPSAAELASGGKPRRTGPVRPTGPRGAPLFGAHSPKSVQWVGRGGLAAPTLHSPGGWPPHTPRERKNTIEPQIARSARSAAAWCRPWFGEALLRAARSGKMPVDRRSRAEKAKRPLPETGKGPEGVAWQRAKRYWVLTTR